MHSNIPIVGPVDGVIEATVQMVVVVECKTGMAVAHSDDIDVTSFSFQ